MVLNGRTTKKNVLKTIFAPQQSQISEEITIFPTCQKSRPLTGLLLFFLVYYGCGKAKKNTYASCWVRKLN